MRPNLRALLTIPQKFSLRVSLRRTGKTQYRTSGILILCVIARCAKIVKTMASLRLRRSPPKIGLLNRIDRTPSQLLRALTGETARGRDCDRALVQQVK